jgi:hypothetical protein
MFVLQSTCRFLAAADCTAVGTGTGRKGFCGLGFTTSGICLWGFPFLPGLSVQAVSCSLLMMLRLLLLLLLLLLYWACWHGGVMQVPD